MNREASDFSPGSRHISQCKSVTNGVTLRLGFSPCRASRDGYRTFEVWAGIYYRRGIRAAVDGHTRSIMCPNTTKYCAKEGHNYAEAFPRWC